MNILELLTICGELVRISLIVIVQSVIAMVWFTILLVMIIICVAILLVIAAWCLEKAMIGVREFAIMIGIMEDEEN